MSGAPDRSELYSSYGSQLQQLRRGLPRPFWWQLDRLLENLPRLLAPDWPLVPNHTDFLENNIHVDPTTGQLKGICDWKDVEISPFGMSLEGLESLLGQRSEDGSWRWVSNQRDLRQVFWNAFGVAMGAGMEDIGQRIDNARLLAIFLRHGFEWNQVTRRMELVRAGSSDFSFLKAVIADIGV